jgi:hypothetical protein
MLTFFDDAIESTFSGMRDINVRLFPMNKTVSAFSSDDEASEDAVSEGAASVCAAATDDMAAACPDVPEGAAPVLSYLHEASESIVINIKTNITLFFIRIL